MLNMARLALVVCFLGLTLGAFAEKKGDWSSEGKVAGDLRKEEGLVAEFSDFCDDELKEVAYAIETAGAQIQDFQAAIVDARSLVAAKKEFPSDEGLPRGAEAEQRGACLGPVQADRGHHDLP